MVLPGLKSLNYSKSRHLHALSGFFKSAEGLYNGSGGVVRSSIEGTGFVDSAAGCPKELPVQFHNEMAYAKQFPRYVTFAMVKQAEAGKFSSYKRFQVMFCQL